jgi:hypothetical protein
MKRLTPNMAVRDVRERHWGKVRNPRVVFSL